jgi:hypothetical protein
MEVGDLSDSGTETPWGLAERVLAALPPDWCGHNAAYLVATHGRQEAEIARLRTALEDHHRGVVLPGGTCAICAALGDGASS